jgi:FkbM family methyltransferase
MNVLKRTIIRALRVILPLRIKNSILHLAYHLAPLEFEWFAHTYCISPSMAAGLGSLSARGFSPRTIVDIGAYEGGWSKMAKGTWPDCHILMFEPNKAKTAILTKLAKDLDCKLFDNLLGATDGNKVRFNLMETGSSFLAERRSVTRDVEIRTLTTLDSLRLKIEKPALLKIDAQGYELEILKGALSSIKSFEAVLLEIAIIEINEGAPLLHDVTAFMDKLGFIACEILEIHRRPLDRAMSQIDVIFLRKESALLADRRYSG